MDDPAKVHQPLIMSILYRQIAEKTLGPSAVLGLFLETSFSGTFSNNYKTQKCQIKTIKQPSLEFREQGTECHWDVFDKGPGDS